MIEQADLLGRLERVEKSRGGWTARCPAHDDRESSLFIWHEDEVRSRLQCRVGCTPAEIAGAIEIAVSQLRPDQVVRYPYYESYEVVRIGLQDFPATPARRRRRLDLRHDGRQASALSPAGPAGGPSQEARVAGHRGGA